MTDLREAYNYMAASATALAAMVYGPAQPVDFTIELSPCRYKVVSAVAVSPSSIESRHCHRLKRRQCFQLPCRQSLANLALEVALMRSFAYERCPRGNAATRHSDQALALQVLGAGRNKSLILLVEERCATVLSGTGRELVCL